MSLGPWKRGPRYCGVGGCIGLHAARGLCYFHYQIEYRAGVLTPLDRSPVGDGEDADEPDAAERAEIAARIEGMRRGRS